MSPRPVLPSGRGQDLGTRCSGVGCYGTSADLHEVVDQRSHVDVGTDRALHGLQLGQVSEHEVGLDLVGAQATVKSTLVVRIASA